MVFRVRDANGEDAHHVIDIDIKCFDDPWPPDYWRVATEDFKINVATFYGTPIGMAVFMLAESEDGKQFIHLAKVAVKPAYRKRGVGSLLMRSIDEFGLHAGAGWAWLTVPESICHGARSIAGWMAKVGFKAQAVHKDCFQSFGQSEDGYLFQYPLRPR